MLSSREYEEFMDQCVYRIASCDEHPRAVLMDCWARAWEEALKETLGEEEEEEVLNG